MSLLTNGDRRRVQEMLAPMPRAVRLVFATQTFGCDTCDDARRILEEVTTVQPLVTLEQVNLVLDRDRAVSHGLELAPGVAIVAVQPDGSEWDPGVRFYGTPAGYEFASLIEAILLVSRGESGLSDASREKLRGITSPMHVQVFVTPT
jgi:alkyl hydroperoxide reductase subunit AhpF